MATNSGVYTKQGYTFFNADSYIHANITVMQDKDVIHLYELLPSPDKQAVRDFIEFLYQKTAVAQQGADLVPLRGELGSMKGQVWMAPDFDAPLEDFRESSAPDPSRIIPDSDSGFIG